MNLIVIDKRIVHIALTVFLLLLTRNSLSQGKDPLLFPKDNFIVETRRVNTTAGEKKVTYRSYMHIPYVTKPVDLDYQSLNVFVPVEVDDVMIEASNEPILFYIGVGGYISSNNAKSNGVPGNPQSRDNVISGKADLALAAGYVLVVPGCRGRDNKDAAGINYGKAPSAIVDLKAAVRYIKHNKGVIPGNVNRIFSTGVSAGGALSALLGSSGNSPLFDIYLEEIGAAEAPDNIFGSACFCPITDLEHADGAYEWMYGPFPIKDGLVDQDLSKQLQDSFVNYQASLNLKGKNGFGLLTADNYTDYLLQFYILPSANKYLLSLTEEKRKDYLANEKWISWDENRASFSFSDYVNHVGRMKGLPAFDDFNMKQPEPNLFGNISTDSRHFTNFSLRQSSGNRSAEIDNDVKELVSLMNAMYFIGEKNEGCASHWWLRQGTSDPHTSQTVMCNLATSLENQARDVNSLLYWDAGHGADEDPEDFIAWMESLSRNFK